MVIEIDNSILMYLKNNPDISTISNEFMALKDLLMSYQRGYHIIIASVDILEFFIQYDKFGDTEKKISQHLLDKRYSFAKYYNDISTHLIVYKNECEIAKNKHYAIDLSELTKIDKSVLICEDMSDCDFYISLVNKMIKEKNESFCLCFDKASCSGSQADVMGAYAVVENKRFTLFIMDSDKDCQDNNRGKSASKAYNFCKQHSQEILSYCEPAVREKENIIPPSFLLLHKNCNDMIGILRFLATLESKDDAFEFLRYIDIKDGVLVKNMRKDDHALYTKYKSFWDQMVKINVIKPFDLNNDEDEKIVFSGIGNGFIAQFQNYILQGGIEKDIANMRLAIAQRGVVDNSEVQQALSQRTMNAEFCKHLLSNLPSYLYDSWNMIYEQLLVFGCCAPETLRISY